MLYPLSYEGGPCAVCCANCADGPHLGVWRLAGCRWESFSARLGADRARRMPCGCRKLCRWWSGGISVLVDESVTAGRFHDLEVSVWLVCWVGGDGWSLVE